MESRDDPFQAEASGFNRKFQIAVLFPNAETGQKGHQPVARLRIVVLRQNFFHAVGVILSRRKIGAKQQKIFWTDERRELWQNFLRLEIRDHAEKGDK